MRTEENRREGKNISEDRVLIVLPWQSDVYTAVDLISSHRKPIKSLTNNTQNKEYDRFSDSEVPNFGSRN